MMGKVYADVSFKISLCYDLFPVSDRNDPFPICSISQVNSLIPKGTGNKE